MLIEPSVIKFDFTLITLPKTLQLINIINWIDFHDSKEHWTF